VKVIDVHPEELLDRELRGQLSDDQRLLLDAHLAQCESCRLERLLRADFAAEAARACEADMQSFVLGALQRAASGEAQSAMLGSHAQPHASAVLPANAGPSRLSRRRLSALVAVACVLLVAAGAAASRSAWVERMFHVTFGEASIEGAPVTKGKRALKQRAAMSAAAPVANEAAPRAEQAKADRVLRDRSDRVAEPSAPLTAPQAVDNERAPQVITAPVETPREIRTQPAEPTRTLESTYRPAPRSARITRISSQRSGKLAFAAARAPKAATTVAPTPLVEPSLAAPAAPAAPDPARVALQVAASSLFEQANKARRSGRLDQAATLYETLQRDHAATAEAKLSLALEARMWLDTGNTYAALGGFDRYLASGERALREEAMTGRALSLERLGRKAAADQAFAELLKAYPYSSYAPLAKKRLGQD
jgi:tetratricopeptide (TPR) repeat protein